MLLRVCHLILLQEEQRQPGESPMWEEALAADFAFHDTLCVKSSSLTHSKENTAR